MTSLSLAFDILAKDNASKTFNTVGDAADNAGRKGSRFGTAMKAGLAAVGVAAVAFGKSSVSAFVESEQASARLDDALKRFPRTNDVTRASFDQLNAALARKTKFDDDATASGQAVLAQFNLTGEQIQDLTPLLQDYAAKTGKDLPDAANVLGKALLGKGKALAEVGIKFKDAGSTGANFEQIMGGLRTQVGGFAAKEGKTAAGQAAILSNQFGEVQEQVGAKLTPVLTRLATILLQVIDFIQRNSAVILPLVAVLGTVLAAVKAYTIAQTALNFVLAANPIGLVVIALAALVAGLVVAWKSSETFRNVVMGVIRFVVDAFLGFAETLVKGAAKAFGWVPGLGGKLKNAAKEIEKFRDDANRSLAGIKDKTITIGLKGAAAAEAFRATERAAINVTVNTTAPVPAAAASATRRAVTLGMVT